MPGKGGALVGGLDELFKRAACICVPHVVENSHAEGPTISRALSGLEAQNFRLSGTIGSRNLVVVRCSGFKLVEADLVEELAALSDGFDFGARWRAVIPMRVSFSFLIQWQERTCAYIHERFDRGAWDACPISQ